jgi:hypothetical protein
MSGGRLRRWSAVTLTVVALVSVVGAALATRYPDSPVLAGAERIPLLGSMVRTLRARYQPSGVESPPPGLTEFELVDAIVGARARVWVDTGSVVRSEPRRDAEPIVTLDALANLPLLEKRDGWAHVELAEMTGWVIPRPESAVPARGSRPAPVLPLPARAPDEMVLSLGLEAFGNPPAEFALGAYRLFTDAGDPALVGRCQAVEAGLEKGYAERFGRTPMGTPAELVLIFRHRRAYEAFWRQTTGLEVAFTGHADRGVAATFVDLRSPRQVCATVAHELTHLINRRAVGPALPPWLEEGLAIEMARHHAGEVGYSGAARAAAAAGALPPVAELLALDVATFRTPSRLKLHYGASGLWMRFLLDSPELAPGLRTFLRYLSLGGPYGPEVDSRPELAAVAVSASLTDDLEVFLGVSIDQLDERFIRWIGSP